VEVSNTSLSVKYWGLVVFAVATLFPRLLQLPDPFGQVQLTEILFLFLLPWYRKDIFRTIGRFPYFALAGGVYVGVNIASALVSGSTAAQLEAAGRGYLLVIALMVAGVADKTVFTTLKKWWATATVTLCLLACIAYGLVVADILPVGPAWGVFLIPDSPYFGTVYRLAASGSSYGMFLMLLLPGLVFLLAAVARQERSPWWLVPVLLAGLLTFAKENLLIVMAILLLGVLFRHWHKWRITGVVGMVITLQAVTHYMPLRTVNQVEGTEFVSDKVVYRPSPDWFVLETNYVAHKRAAWVLGLRSPWLGLGPGQFREHTPSLMATGKYPAHLAGFDPHSAWTGALAETGWLGLVSLLGLVLSLYWYRPGDWTAPAVLLLLFLIASVFKDVMNFRGLWVIIGVYLGDGQWPSSTIREV